MLDPCTRWLSRLKKILLVYFLSGFTTNIIGWRGKGSLNSNKTKLRKKGLLKHHVYGPLRS